MTAAARTMEKPKRHILTLDQASLDAQRHLLPILNKEYLSRTFSLNTAYRLPTDGKDLYTLIASVSEQGSDSTIVQILAPSGFSIMRCSALPGPKSKEELLGGLTQGFAALDQMMLDEDLKRIWIMTERMYFEKVKSHYRR